MAVQSAGKRMMATLAVFGGLMGLAASLDIAAEVPRPLRSPADIPVTLVAPSSGAPILVWSQFDGSARKLAWSRFENGRWIDPRYLTFGPGDDLAPVAGTSSTGSLLLWIDERGRVYYAPFDPDNGRLFAVPHPLPMAGNLGPGARGDGGADAPIILGICGETKKHPCVGSSSSTSVSSTAGTSLALEGGTDAPIVLNTGSTTVTTLTVASYVACGTQVVAVASEGEVIVFAIDANGRATVLSRYLLDPDVDAGAATAAAAAYFLDTTCT